MLRKIAIVLATIMTLNTTPVFADQAIWRYPNNTLKGDNMETIPCTIRTAFGDKTIDAIFYEGKSYIPLNAFRELSLNNIKVKDVQYYAYPIVNNYQEANFDIEFTRAGDEETVFIIGGDNDIPFDDCWRLNTFISRSPGDDCDFELSYELKEVINRNGYLYIPLSFIRDNCFIEVQWKDENGNRSINIPGSNTILECLTEQEEPDNPSNEFTFNLSWGDKTYEITSATTQEEFKDIMKSYISNIKSGEPELSDNFDMPLGEINYTFKNMTKEESLKHLMIGCHYILAYPEVKVYMSNPNMSVEEFSTETISDFFAASMLFATLSQALSDADDEKLKVIVDAFADEDKLFEYESLYNDSLKKALHTTDKNTSDREFVINFLDNWMKFVKDDVNALVGNVPVAVDPPISNPAEELKFTFGNIVFAPNIETTQVEYDEVLQAVSKNCQTKDIMDFGLDVSKVDTNVLAEVSSVVKEKVLIACQAYSGNITDLEAWEHFYYDAVTPQVTAIHALSLYSMNEETVTDYFNNIKDASKAINQFDMIDEVTVKSACGTANKIYLATGDELQACLSFDMYILNNCFQ